MKIRLANLDDFENIIELIDNEFTKEGFGFVNREQVRTEIRKGRVFLALDGSDLLGCRIGIDTVWNMVVSKASRGQGVGKALIEYHRPRTIRVKADPIGHLSKAQRDNFTDPTGFYEALGYKYWGNAYPKNFWQRGKNGKGQFHSRGETAHIKIYKDPNTLLFELAH